MVGIFMVGTFMVGILVIGMFIKFTLHNPVITQFPPESLIETLMASCISRRLCLMLVGKNQCSYFESMYFLEFYRGGVVIEYSRFNYW